MSYLFPLDVARTKAAEIMEKLAPHAERIEIAGSIRRGKALVKDIDLVAIPKMESRDALFGTVSEVGQTNFYESVRNMLTQITSEGQRIVRGHTLAEGDRGIPLDVYIATPETWATLLLIRTGSAEHNMWMCGRARSCGGKLHADGSGLEVPGQYDAVLQRTANAQVIRTKTEEEIFKAMGIPYIEPKERECVNGRPAWMRGVIG